MHTQRELCAKVHRWGRAYVLMAKDNQPTLAEDSADLFEDRAPDRRRWERMRVKRVLVTFPACWLGSTVRFCA